jgi:hypothetical protein
MNPRLKINLFSVPIFLFIFIISNAYSQCGIERWDVKTLTDKDTSKIKFSKIVKSTIHKQISMKKPAKITKNLARLKNERTVYKINALVVSYKLEADKDFHVVISDLRTGENMVVEIVDPECPGIKSTSRYKELKALHDWFTNEFHPTGSFQHVSKKVTLTGVGFFDFLHGQHGMASNGREIHPVLKMEYAD